MHGMSGDGGSRSRRDRSPPKGKIKINKKIRNSQIITHFFSVSESLNWIPKPKINRTICWLLGLYDFSCLIFSILTYFIMMFINDAKYFFNSTICVWARKLYRFYYTILLKSSYSKQKGNAKLILLHFWRSRLYTQSSP